MRFDAVLFDNGGTLTHRTSPVAAVCSSPPGWAWTISEEDAARATGGGPRNTAAR